jgi:hypothetical protein
MIDNLKKSKPATKVRMNFTIDELISDKFKKLCSDKSVNMSSLIEKFMRNFSEKYDKR